MVLAAERLDKVPPGQRGWEWRYLKRQTRGGLFTLYGHTGGVLSVAFQPDGTRIVTGSLDQTAKVWDARTGTPLLELKGHTGGCWSVAFQPGRHADRHRQCTTRRRRCGTRSTGTPLARLKGHTGGVTSVAFSPDGTRIVTGSEDRTAKVWDARTGTPLLELKGHTGRVASVAFQPGRHADRHRQLRQDGEGVGRADRHAPARTQGAHGPGDGVAFSPDGTRIVTGSGDKTAKVWDARTGTLLLELKGHTGEVWSVRFSPDGTRIVTGSADRTAKVWDARTGTPPARAQGAHGLGLERAFQPRRHADRHRQ